MEIERITNMKHDKIKKFTLFQEIQHKAEEFGVTVNFDRNDIISLQQADCIWYNETDIATITKMIDSKEYTLHLDAVGEVHIYGRINGEEVQYDNNNIGDLCRDYGCTDNELYKLLDSQDENNYLEFQNNNWLEGFYSVNGELDNCYSVVIDESNILEVMSDLGSLVDMLDEFIKEHEATLVQRKSEPEIEKE